MYADELKAKVNELIAKKEYDEIKQVLLANKDTTEHDNDLAITCYLCTIYEQERDAGQPVLFSKVADLEELLERYTTLKFYLRRMDFDVMDCDGIDYDVVGCDTKQGKMTGTGKAMEVFYQFLSHEQISSYELLRVIDFCVVHKEKVLQIIKGDLPTATSSDGELQEDGELYEDEELHEDGELYEDEELHEDERVAEEREISGEQEICFILCSNHQAYTKECLYYINHLKIPKGYRIDVLTVEEAKSMTSGYNEAMQYSKAKYKVYLHQDTFLINPNFIYDILRIFRQDKSIGMIGNIGVEKMPESGVMWDADRFGMLYEQHIYETELLANHFSSEKDFLDVDAIDGFIMITQYDVLWREDLFDKWDFYDCSQSMEFKRKGYRVVIPQMQEPWCVHDCGFINLSKYDLEREKFVKEYLL